MTAMSVLGQSSGYSPTGQALGLSGDPLSQQVKDETEEERRRRLQLAQVRQAVGPASMALGLGV
jgi:hypothetical protein